MIRFAIPALALGLLLGGGGMFWLQRDGVATQREMIALQAELVSERSRTALLRGLLDAAEVEIEAAEVAVREIERLRAEDRARLLSMEDLVDEIRAAPGADRPVSGALLDALQLPD
jgi:uncharacterized protein HemX